MKRAFTLIELLVVIAIIAILAAMLFPVYAQAKTAAQKTTVISNTKQAGTAMLMYLSDNDDAFPSMHAIDPITNTVVSGPVSASGLGPYRLWSIPAGWGVNAAARQADEVAFHNAIHPYTKSFDIYGGAGLNLYTSGFNYATAPANLPIVALSGNGLLHLWNAGAIATPSKLPMMWFGNGKEAYRGYGYTSPYLRCTFVGTATNQAPPCRFNPSGAVQAGLTARSREDTYEFTFVPANDTVRSFQNGNIYVSADSSARFKRMGSDTSTPAGSNVTALDEPGYTYGGPPAEPGYPAGHVISPMRCVSAPGSPHYMSMFRPDSTFAYQYGTTGTNALCFP